MTYKFPDGFMWGVATAAHQVEGNNINCDSWLLENMPDSIFAEPSFDADDHYHRYPQDIAMLGELGLNAYRFSIEWARIEPEEGYFSHAEIEHYRRMLAACHENGITPVVTFHHCTSPRWLIANGGWQEKKTVDFFARYCGYAARHLGDLMGVALTINQPNLPIMQLHQGFIPPVEKLAELPWVKNASQRFGVAPEKFRTYTYASAPGDVDILINSHKRAVEAIKSERPELPTGWPLVIDYLHPKHEGLEDVVEKLRHEIIDVFLEASMNDDILGVQAYSRLWVGPDGIEKPPAELVPPGSIGWGEYYPDVLELALRYFSSKVDVPLLVTENGLPAEDDSRRVDWINHSVKGLCKCLDDGIDVRGYLHWSAMDNFEWELGYPPKFGVISIDRETQERTINESARLLGRLARHNACDAA